MKTKKGFTRPKFFSKNLRGFTLIELLVVIAIIGVLASVVLASLNSARQKSRDVRRIADIKQLQLALEMYFDSCRQYPNVLALTTANGCSGSTNFGNFMPAIPVDPISSRACDGFTAPAYCYGGLDTDSVAASCESYHIGASLEDTGHSALSADADAAAGTLCTGAATFAGTDPIYDMKP